MHVVVTYQLCVQGLLHQLSLDHLQALKATQKVRPATYHHLPE